MERGILERRDGRVFGIFPHTTWPAADTAHEEEVRRALTAALVQGFTPDDKTVDTQGLGGRAVRRRDKEIAEGDWASKAVRDAAGVPGRGGGGDRRDAAAAGSS